MNRKLIGIVSAACISVTALSGCAALPQATPQAAPAPETAAETTADAAEETAAEETVAEETVAPEEAPAEEAAETETASEDLTVRVGSLKGPTSIGLVKLMHEEADNDYSFTMETQADVLLSGVVSGDLDIALIPANVASVLYNKTKGGIRVIDINTLGVLYMVSGDSSIESIADLAGRTVYTTGAGSTPEYALRYLLAENGLTDEVAIEFKSEATEVAALLAAEPDAVGMLPQPFVTAALAQNDALSIVLDMTEEWNRLNNDSQLVTGVTIAREAFLAEHPEAVTQFLTDHAESVAFTNTETAQAAEYTAEAGIIEKAPVAEKAIPFCNIVCITGADMQKALSGYLSVLFDQEPASVGGALPEDDFYYLP